MNGEFEAKLEPRHVEMWRAFLAHADLSFADRWQATVYEHIVEREELEARHARELLALLRDPDADSTHREIQERHWRTVAGVHDERAQRARRLAYEVLGVSGEAGDTQALGS